MGKKESPLISIIIPAYNAEEYIEKCIDSVTSQSYDKLEIIIIDDGSVDGTKKIIEDAKKHDNRIILFSIENGGPSKARNTGIEHATGEWLLFVDSDDTLRNNACEILLGNALKYHADIVGGGYVGNTPAGYRKLYKIESDVPVVLSEGENLAMEFSKSQILNDTGFIIYPVNNVCWGKLVKSCLVKNNNEVRFPLEMYKSEDRIFNTKLYLHSQKHICVPDIICEKSDRTDSISHSIMKDGFISAVRYIEYVNTVFPDVPQNELRRIFLRRVMLLAFEYGLKDCKTMKNHLNELRNQPVYKKLVKNCEKSYSFNRGFIYGVGECVFDFLLVSKMDYLILLYLKICKKMIAIRSLKR